MQLKQYLNVNIKHMEKLKQAHRSTKLKILNTKQICVQKGHVHREKQYHTNNSKGCGAVSRDGG